MTNEDTNGGSGVGNETGNTGAARNPGAPLFQAPVFQAPDFSAYATAAELEPTVTRKRNEKPSAERKTTNSRRKARETESAEVDAAGNGRTRRRKSRRDDAADTENVSENTTGNEESQTDPEAESRKGNATDDAGMDSAANTDEDAGARRRRRRRGRDSDETDSSAGSAKSAKDEVTALEGSTRLEAKRQRRKEGRKENKKKNSVTDAEFLARRE